MTDEGTQIAVVGGRSIGSGHGETCECDDACDNPAAYLIAYNFGLDDDMEPEWATCVEHTAELRANDPLGYVASVRTLRAGDGRG